MGEEKVGFIGDEVLREHFFNSENHIAFREILANNSSCVDELVIGVTSVWRGLDDDFYAKASNNFYFFGSEGTPSFPFVFLFSKYTDCSLSFHLIINLLVSYRFPF